MKKKLFTSILLLSLTSLFAQNTPAIPESSSSKSGTAPTAVGDFKLTVKHAGVDGALIKSSSLYSVVDVDANNGDAAVRFAKNGNTLWGVGNTPTNDYFRIFEFDLGSPFVIQKNTGAIGIGTLLPSSRLEVSSEGLTDLRISSSAGFGATRLSYISDKGTLGEWRPAIIQSGDHGTYTGRIDFFTNGTGGANKFSSVYSMSIMNKRVTIGDGFASTTPYSLELHSPNSYGFTNFSNDNLKYWEQYSSIGGDLQLYAIGSYRGAFNGTTGAYTSVSDKSLKNNISALSPILDKVLLLQPSTYEYKDNNPIHRKSIGLIAQDVEAIFPEFVYKNFDERSGKEIYTMDYSGLSVVALKAIQEQQEMIKALQAEVAKLKK